MQSSVLPTICSDWSGHVCLWFAWFYLEGREPQPAAATAVACAMQAMQPGDAETGILRIAFCFLTEPATTPAMRKASSHAQACDIFSLTIASASMAPADGEWVLSGNGL